MWGGISLQFWFAFPKWLMMLSTFYVLIGHLYIFFEEMSIQAFCPFSNWFFCSCWVLVVYIFWILILVRYTICKYFLSFCGLPFYYVDSVFRAQNFKIFMKSNLSIFSFVACAFWVIFKKSSPYPRLWRFCRIFSPKSLMALGLTLRSLIHFELILYMVKGNGPN